MAKKQNKPVPSKPCAMARSRQLSGRTRARIATSSPSPSPGSAGKDDLRDTDSFSGAQLPRRARLAGKAYDRVTQLTRDARKDENAEADNRE